MCKSTRWHIGLPLLLVLVCQMSAWAEDTAANAPVSSLRELTSLLLPLIVVIAAGIGALWWVKRRYAQAGGNPELRIRSVVAVGPRERIVLLETREQMLVVGVSSSALTTLAHWPADRKNSAEDASQESNLTRFRNS